MVPQLIPREPVNIDGVKAGFTSVRPNLSAMPMTQQLEIDIDPTRDAPMAEFDGNCFVRHRNGFSSRSRDLECDIPLSINERSKTKQ